jgi:hypothetical protein
MIIMIMMLINFKLFAGGELTKAHGNAHDISSRPLSPAASAIWKQNVTVRGRWLCKQ